LLSAPPYQRISHSTTPTSTITALDLLLMSVEPTHQGGDIFLCPKNKTMHHFFQDNCDNITSRNVQNFLGRYPSDL
jgi:hypothetical protein